MLLRLDREPELTSPCPPGLRRQASRRSPVPDATAMAGTGTTLWPSRSRAVPSPGHLSALGSALPTGSGPRSGRLWPSRTAATSFHILTRGLGRRGPLHRRDCVPLGSAAGDVHCPPAGWANGFDAERARPGSRGCHLDPAWALRVELPERDVPELPAREVEPEIDPVDRADLRQVHVVGSTVGAVGGRTDRPGLHIDLTVFGEHAEPGRIAHWEVVRGALLGERECRGVARWISLDTGIRAKGPRGAGHGCGTAGC